MADNVAAPDDLKLRCFQNRFHCFGTARIFERRAWSLGIKRRVITFLGLASPLFLGAFVGAYNTDLPELKLIVLPVVGAVTIFQSVMSLWSLVAQWDDAYGYSVASTQNNMRLASAFDSLAAAGGQSMAEELEKLGELYSRQEDADLAKEVSAKERRYGYRCALFQYRNTCPVCKCVPETLKPSECSLCGDF